MIAKLTTLTLRKLKPRDKPYEVLDPELKGFLIRIQPTGLQTYYFSYTGNNGKRRRIKIGKTVSLTPMQARDIAKKHAGNMSSGMDPQENKKKNKLQLHVQENQTLRNFLNNGYESYLLTHHKRGNDTVARLKTKFSFLIDTPMPLITRGELQDWILKEKSAGLKPSTINRNLMALKSAMNSAVSGISNHQAVIAINPIASIKPLKVDKNREPRFLTAIEEVRLKAALRTRDSNKIKSRMSANNWRQERHYEVLSGGRGLFFDHLTPMILISLNTGIRRGELFSLEWVDVDFSLQRIKILGEKSKSGNTRFVPLNSESLDVLRQWELGRGDDQLVFPSKGGNQFTTIKTAWRRLLVQAEVKCFRWHDMRHTFASNLVSNGVDLYVVKELLGHSSLEMTEIYSHLAPHKQIEAVNTLGHRSKVAK